MFAEVSAWVAFIVASMLICVVVVVAHFWRDNKTEGVRRWFSDEHMPLILRQSTLFMSEAEISMTQPVALRGRVDQVFMSKNGLLILLDTKTRSHHRVYGTDVWQLAVYAAILDVTVRHPLSSYGFVRTVVRTETTRSVQYHVIRLPPFEAIVSVAQKQAE